jgi:uncharacterized repeat protein (TIGR03803 family)
MSCKKFVKPCWKRVLTFNWCYSGKPQLVLGVFVSVWTDFCIKGAEMGSKRFWYYASKALAVVGVAAILVSGVWAANSEKVLYTFTGGNDGGNPAAQLTFDSSGNIYGTTVVGGASGLGTVFKLMPHSSGKWTETVLYSFTGGSDGKAPHGGVTLDAKGNLYGTAVAGGIGTCSGDGCGTVFKLTNSGGSWAFSVLYSFTGGTDGFGPGGGVVFDKKGNLYGTTPDGGSQDGCSGSGCGVVYKLSPAKGGQWTEKVIHRFTGGKDGSTGSLGLLLLDKTGNLYGVAELGGAHGAGTAFKMTSSSGGKWNLSTIDGFKGMPNAGFPYGGLISDKAGSLYGTTYYAGANGIGSVFKLTGSKSKFTESVLYSFKNGTDGNSPTSTLVFDAHGNLYGTTSAGGDANGDGTVFKLAPSSGGRWKESVVHRFQNNQDGANPYYGMTLDRAGNLYGTTASGGAQGQGVIFELTP